jgi:hypothetical protein
MLRLPLSKKERGVLNDTSHKSALTMSNTDNEEAVHNPSHWDGGNEYGQLQFQSTTLNQQAEKLQVAHQSSAITPTRLVPLPQEDAARRSRAGRSPTRRAGLFHSK